MYVQPCAGNAEEPQRKDAVLRVGAALGGGLVDWVGKDANEGLPGMEAVAKSGLSAGLLAALNLDKVLSFSIEPIQLSLQAEFLYSGKGSKFVIDGEDRASTDMVYLQTGLLLRADYVMTGRFAPYAVLGPELGFLHSVEFKTRSGNTSNTKDDYKSTDFGLILGLGTMFELPPYGSLGLELRGDLGLVSIDGQGDGDEIRNAALTLLLVYLY